MIKFIFLVIRACLIVRGVGAVGLIQNILGCLDPATVDYNHDYFTNKVSPAYSKYWKITYHNTYKIVYNNYADVSYLLYQCGTTPPSSESGRHNATFSIPQEAGVIITESDQIPSLEQLDLRLKIKAFVGDPTYMASPCLKKLRDDKNLTILNDFFYMDGTNLSDFLLQNPKAILFDSNEMKYPNNTFLVSAYQEGSSIAKYEWSKVYSTIFNEEATANANFNSALSRYLCTSSNAAFLQQKEMRGLSTQQLQQQNAKHTVLWAYYIDYGNEKGWDVGECDRQSNYYCELAYQCSANLLASSNGSIQSYYYPGQRYMTDDEFFAFGKNASVWIYPGYNWDQVYLNHKEALSKFESVKNHQVFDVQGSGEYAWFEQATAEFDIVLQDFCSVISLYDEANIPYTRKYLRKLLPTAEPLGSMGTCSTSDLSEPWDSRAAPCNFLSAQKTSSSSRQYLVSMMWITIGMAIGNVAWFM